MKNILLSLLVVVLFIGSANMFAMDMGVERVINSGLSVQQLRDVETASKLGAAKFSAVKGAANFSIPDLKAWIAAGRPAPGAVAPVMPLGGAGAPVAVAPVVPAVVPVVPAYNGPTYAQLYARAQAASTFLADYEDVIRGLKAEAGNIPGILPGQIASFDELIKSKYLNEQQTMENAHKAELLKRALAASTFERAMAIIDQYQLDHPNMDVSDVKMELKRYR